MLKNALYFGGAPLSLMTQMFPPPAYELPSNAFFEITGMLQVVPASLAGWSLYRLIRLRRAPSITMSHNYRIQAGRLSSRRTS
jgi:hypothetical protein